MTVPATVASVYPGSVTIRARDGREWDLDIRDIDGGLAREGQPISLEHDGDGWVTNIVARDPDPLPQELKERMDAALRWADSL